MHLLQFLSYSRGDAVVALSDIAFVQSMYIQSPQHNSGMASAEFALSECSCYIRLLQRLLISIRNDTVVSANDSFKTSHSSSLHLYHSVQLRLLLRHSLVQTCLPTFIYYQDYSSGLMVMIMND